MCDIIALNYPVEMTEPNTEGLGSGHESIRASDPSKDAAASDSHVTPGNPATEPLDEISPRDTFDSTPIAEFARTFRLSLRNSFNELLRPLQSLVPEHEVVPAWIGGGYDVLRCGHCDFAIAECVDIEQMRRQTLYCPRCTAENQVP